MTLIRMLHSLGLAQAGKSWSLHANANGILSEDLNLTLVLWPESHQRTALFLLQQNFSQKFGFH